MPEWGFTVSVTVPAIAVPGPHGGRGLRDAEGPVRVPVATANMTLA